MVDRTPVHRVALLGGSFDPPHRGHLALARAALEQLPVDELWWLPAGQPWQKSRRLTEAAHRLAMLRVMLGQDRAGQAPARDPRQRIETCEIDRGGPTYTIDTLEELARRHPQVQWTLVIGQDQLQGLRSWHRWSDVVRRAALAVAIRPASQTPVGAEPAAQPAAEPAAEPAAQHAAGLAGPPGATLTVVRMTPDAVSSTEIRHALACGAADVPGLTPEVAGYIAQQGLYRPTG